MTTTLVSGILNALHAIYPVIPLTDPNGGMSALFDTAISSGSNSNGSYIKFGDGTMWCWGFVGTISNGTNQAYTLTYPAAFINDYTSGQSFIYGISSNAGNYPSSYISNGYPSTTQAQVTYTVAGTVARLSWSAIGKYK